MMSKFDQNNTNKVKTEVALGVLLAELEQAKELLDTPQYMEDIELPKIMEKLKGIEETVLMLAKSLHPDPKPIKVYNVGSNFEVIACLEAEGETREEAERIAGILMVMIGARGWMRIMHRVFFPVQRTKADARKHALIAEGLDGLHFQPVKE